MRVEASTARPSPARIPAKQHAAPAGLVSYPGRVTRAATYIARAIYFIARQHAAPAGRVTARVRPESPSRESLVLAESPSREARLRDSARLGQPWWLWPTRAAAPNHKQTL
jgi:hypothetical protein